VTEYLKPQKRFADLFREGAEDTARIEAIQSMADHNIARFNLLGEEGGAR
jgi:hypothetical protein